MDYRDEIVAEAAMKHAEERSRLRDELAMAALTGLLASRTYATKEEAARDAYEQADACMKVRNS